LGRLVDSRYVNLSGGWHYRRALVSCRAEVHGRGLTGLHDEGVDNGIVLVLAIVLAVAIGAVVATRVSKSFRGTDR
jgi:hypothetical protein